MNYLFTILQVALQCFLLYFVVEGLEPDLQKRFVFLYIAMTAYVQAWTSK